MSIPSSCGTCGQLACLAHSARRSSSAGQGGGPPRCRSWCDVRWHCWLHSQLSSGHRELRKSPSRRPVPAAAKIFNFTILQPLEVFLEVCIRQRMQARLSAHLYEKGHLISATTGKKLALSLSWASLVRMNGPVGLSLFLNHPLTVLSSSPSNSVLRAPPSALSQQVALRSWHGWLPGSSQWGRASTSSSCCSLRLVSCRHKPLLMWLFSGSLF